MTIKKPEQGSPAPADMSLQQATRFLEIGLSGNERPVDELIDRLEQADGVKWLSKAIQDQPLQPLADAAGESNPPSVSELVAMKEASKKLLRRGGRTEDRLFATARYFFSIGAALAFHNEVICSRKREELDPILLDLASATAPPWSPMFEQAVNAQAGKS